MGSMPVTIRCVDPQATVDAKMRPRGRSKPVEERDEQDMLRTAARAKKCVRHAANIIGVRSAIFLKTVVAGLKFG